MNKERLELMSTMLTEVTEGVWKGVPVDHHIKFGPVKLFEKQIGEFDLGTWVTKTDCGFAACAVGHACFDRRFREQLLTVDEWNRPMFTGQDGVFRVWDAVEKFFGIKYDTALILFLPSSYPWFHNDGVRPGQVKVRVDELLTFGEEKFLETHAQFLNDEEDADEDAE